MTSDVGIVAKMMNVDDICDEPRQDKSGDSTLPVGCDGMPVGLQSAAVPPGDAFSEEELCINTLNTILASSAEYYASGVLRGEASAGDVVEPKEAAEYVCLIASILKSAAAASPEALQRLLFDASYNVFDTFVALVRVIVP